MALALLEVGGWPVQQQLPPIPAWGVGLCRAGSSGDWGDAAGLVLRGKGIVWAWFPARRMVLLLRLGGVLGQGRGVGEACSFDMN